jgi:hypothetical protein
MMINTTMDRDDLRPPPARAIVAELNSLILSLKERGLRPSSWYGCFDLSGAPDSYERINRGYAYAPLEGAADDHNVPWFLYWEIVWIVRHGGLDGSQRVIDLGGASSLFSYYLASKGHAVTTVDLQQPLVDAADRVAGVMGWNLTNLVMDLRGLSIADRFDHVTSVCVFEHLPMHDRAPASRAIRELLVDGGRFSLTFDFQNPTRRARIGSALDLEEQFVAPSGLAVRGNVGFRDNGKRYLLHPFYHPATPREERERLVQRGDFDAADLAVRKTTNDYTFGALFLEKRGP